MDYERLVLVFVVTALWDVVLRLFAEQRLPLLGIESWSWVRALRPYFAEHTTLGAALIAGFVGAVAYALIQLPDASTWRPLTYTLWVAFVSAALGAPTQQPAIPRGGDTVAVRRHYDRASTSTLAEP